MKKLSLLLVIITLLTFFTSCTTKKYDSFQELSNGSTHYVLQANLYYSNIFINPI